MGTDLRRMGLWAVMVVSETSRRRRRRIMVVVAAMVGGELSLVLRFEEGGGRDVTAFIVLNSGHLNENFMFFFLFQKKNGPFVCLSFWFPLD